MLWDRCAGRGAVGEEISGSTPPAWNFEVVFETRLSRGVEFLFGLFTWTEGRVGLGVVRREFVGFEFVGVARPRPRGRFQP
jgi:hypothetical protein